MKVENKIRVLVLSNTPWSIENSFGNSFSNIFSGISGLEFANIYCRYGSPYNDIVNRHFQITEKSQVLNLLNKKNQSGREIFNKSQSDVLDKKSKKIFDHARVSRHQVYFWARDLIWAIGRWKSAELENFIKEFKPDLLFQPVYYSIYINNIALYLKEFTQVPMVGYVSDDVYTLRQFSFSPLYWINRLIIRKKVKKIINKCEHLYVISEIQKQEYQRCFNINCKILAKAAEFNGPAPIKRKVNKPLMIVYTGNIGGGRWVMLSLMGQALKRINEYQTLAQLFVYSKTPVTNRIKKSLNIENSIRFMGGISAAEVVPIQENADILVHVESFELRERLAVRHSFSTKLIDYFSVARCIFAIGSPGVASIDHLKKNDAAIIATSKNEIFPQLDRLINDNSLITTYAEKAWACGKQNHQKSKMQKSLFLDLNSLTDRDQNISSALS